MSEPKRHDGPRKKAKSVVSDSSHVTKLQVKTATEDVHMDTIVKPEHPPSPTRVATSPPSPEPQTKKRQRAHFQDEESDNESIVDETLIVVDIPDNPAYLYQESVMFLHAIDSNRPVLRIAGKELTGKYEDFVGTGMIFQEVKGSTSTNASIHVDSSVPLAKMENAGFGDIADAERRSSASGKSKGKKQKKDSPSDGVFSESSGRFEFAGKTIKRLVFRAT
jgi:hypothetical protein